MPQSLLSSLWYDVNYWTLKSLATLAFSLRLEGAGNVPARGPALLIANHESFLDPILVGMAVRRRLRYLARKTLFKNPHFARFLLSVGCVPVDQQGVAKEGLKRVLELLGEGEAVLVFPEGERTWTGRMQPLKPGVQLLVKRTPAPIVPVGVAGAFEAWPRTRRWPTVCPLFWPATASGGIAVSVGRPLPPGRFADLPREQFSQGLFNEIQVVRERARRLRRKPAAAAAPVPV